jgi:CheY-like chemotaxis protein
MNQIVPTKIIVIHDDIFDDENYTSPIMVSLKLKYGESNIKLFRHSKEGLEYVLDNLGQKMVVLLDRNFHDGREMDGIAVFEKIREETSLVYVILVTVSKISDIDAEILKKLINKDLFKLESFTADYTKIVNLIDEAVQILDVRIDAVIEDWIVRHPVEKRDQVILKTKEGETYTMNDLLESIRKQTEVGITFEKNLLKLAIELFSRQKLKLDE